MENRIALVGIIVEDFHSVEEVNVLLHEYRQYIIGRMGLPYEKKKIAIISVVFDAPQNIISAFTGKVGMLTGINIKTVYSKIETK